MRDSVDGWQGFPEIAVGFTNLRGAKSEGTTESDGKQLSLFWGGDISREKLWRPPELKRDVERIAPQPMRYTVN